MQHEEILAFALFADEINGFKGEFRWLSNFWEIEPFKYGKSLEFKTVENFYMAMKVHQRHTTPVRANPNSYELVDVNTRKHISTMSPSQAKKFARSASLRPDWEDIKVSVMRYALNIKFNQPKMKELLLATRDIEIVELNNWGDTFWGVDPKYGGENMLGKLIMEKRDLLKSELKLEKLKKEENTVDNTSKKKSIKLKI